MRRADISRIALITILVVMVVSVTCAVSCYGPQAFMPPCHQRSHSCGPVFRIAVSPHASAIVLPPLAAGLTPLNRLNAPPVPLHAFLFEPAEESPPGLDPPAFSILRI